MDTAPNADLGKIRSTAKSTREVMRGAAAQSLRPKFTSAPLPKQAPRPPASSTDGNQGASSSSRPASLLKGWLWPKRPAAGTDGGATGIQPPKDQPKEELDAWRDQRRPATPRKDELDPWKDMRRAQQDVWGGQRRAPMASNGWSSNGWSSEGRGSRNIEAHQIQPPNDTPPSSPRRKVKVAYYSKGTTTAFESWYASPPSQPVTRDLDPMPPTSPPGRGRKSGCAAEHKDVSVRAIATDDREVSITVNGFAAGLERIPSSEGSANGNPGMKHWPSLERDVVCA